MWYGALLLSILMAQIAFTTVDRGDQSRIEEPRTVAIRTAADWRVLWKEHAGDRPLPAIDFGTAMVVAVFAGTRPTAGHGIEVTTVEPQAGGLVVTYRETAPRPDEMVAQMLTAPFHIVRTDTHRGAVTFRRAR